MTMTWLPFAIKHPGPEWKQGYPSVPATTLGEKEGEVKHSAEGPLTALFAELDRPDRTASWHFSIAKKGDIYQHYPLESVTWHCGLPGDRRTDTSLIGNLTLIGEEHEGGGPNAPGEPLTEPQYQASLRLSRALREYCPRIAAKPPTLKVNLWEHRWLSWTSCPSGRIPWQRLIADLEEDMFTQEDKLYLAGLMRGVVRALSRGGTFNTPLRAGDDSYTEAEHNLAQVLQAVATAAPTTTGVTPAQVEQIVERVLKRQKLVVG